MLKRYVTICFTDSILEPPPIQINGEAIERVNTLKLLGYGSKILLNGICIRKWLPARQTNLLQWRPEVF